MARALALRFTVKLVSESTSDGPHGTHRTRLDPAPDGGDCEEVLGQFAKAGIDIDALAALPQDESADSESGPARQQNGWQRALFN